MVVDGKGKIFEDRRNSDTRRKNDFDATGGRRSDKDRRKAVEEPKKKNKK